VDLLVDLRAPDGGPLRQRLEREIRSAVQAGRLLPGTALPSTRALSAQLGISRGTIVEAYAQLVAEGYLSARQGAATVVAARARAGARPPEPLGGRGQGGPAAAGDRGQGGPAPARGQGEPAPARGRGGEPAPARDRDDGAEAPPRYDFRYGVPDLAAFPRAAWLAAGARTLRALPDARLGYGDARGAIELREALAAYLGRARGVVADPQRMLIGGGTRQSLGLVWRVLREQGARRVAIEDPGWSAQQETVRDAGLEPVAVAVDVDGLRVDDLARLDVDAVALTPAHQCPTGALLSPARRAALLAWARQRDTLVVEDDYDAEYRYDRAPVGALQGMAPDCVAYAGSASKTLAPALRLGWLLLPGELAAAAAAHKSRADRGEPLAHQLQLAELIVRGELDRHLRRTRRRYRARRDALVAAVAAELPGAQIEGIAAGLHAVVRLPEGADEAATVRAAARRGVALDGLDAFRRAPGPLPGPGSLRPRGALVLGYGNLSEPAIARGIAELAGAMR
jgi:GntR family transcriptional regulator/MocR family aminotransferase